MNGINSFLLMRLLLSQGEDNKKIEYGEQSITLKENIL